jgi:hypothetical protein
MYALYISVAQVLQDVMALIAYEIPENSPLGYFMTADYRDQVATSLNSAMLGK